MITPVIFTATPGTRTFIAECIAEVVDAAPDRTSQTDLAFTIIDEISTQFPAEWEEYTRPAVVNQVLFDIRSLNARTRRADAFSTIKDTAHLRRSGEQAYYGVGGGDMSRLMSMTKQEVLETAQHLRDVAQGAAFKATLLERIAKKMRADQVVSDVWPTEKLTKLVGDVQALFHS